MLRAENITKKFDEQCILEHASVEFKNGTLNLITGANGVGKSTFLKILYGVMISDEGNVFYKEEDIEKNRLNYLKNIGVITTDDRTLYYKLTARENLRYIGRIMDVPKKELESRITEILNLFKIEDNKKLVEDFSTGMKKKVLIARALIHKPLIIFADEPFNGLDFETTQIVNDFFKKVVNEGKTVILISHNYQYLFENIHRYELRDKKIIEIGDNNDKSFD